MELVYKNREASNVDGNDPATMPHRPTETARVYQQLKHEILAGAFRPGEPLQEERIAARYGASRTPVREAFGRLVADGLLETAPRRGVTVKQPSMRDFLDINELRTVLEPVAARMAATTMPRETIVALLDSLGTIASAGPGEDDFVALEALDRAMHAAIAASLANRRMATILDGMNDMMQIVRQRDMRERHAEMHDSIGGILEAIAARAPDVAERLMRRHVEDFGFALSRLA